MPDRDGSRQLHLNLFLMAMGHAPGAWRSPRTEPERVRDHTYYSELARTGERGLFDAIFLSDNPSLLEAAKFQPQQPLEPLTLLASMATETDKIGLIGSASTTFNHPFNLARTFASLDHLSAGRAAWNIVTTSSPVAAVNFGLEGSPDHDWRYRRATEFIEACKKLWDSWEGDAEIFDRESGYYLDMDRIHEIDHEGEEFKIRGPMSIQRPPQGYPVFFQAGASEAGKDFAARYAEAMFIAPRDPDSSRELSRELKDRAAAYGRRPSQILAFPILTPILGGTEEEAKAIEQEMLDLTSVENTILQINNMTAGVDLSQFPLDAPFPDLGSIRAFNGTQFAAEQLVSLARREDLTVRGVIEHYRTKRYGFTFVGTPDQLTEKMVEWFETEAADGFMIGSPYFPGALDDFVDTVVPLLQKRGIYREGYEGDTLRDHYGLDYPSNQYEDARVGASA
jgi:FMN-dependent oxidoreductase (nitrilotriacetate monooxygenase family)